MSYGNTSDTRNIIEYDYNTYNKAYLYKNSHLFRGNVEMTINTKMVLEVLHIKAIVAVEEVIEILLVLST